MSLLNFSARGEALVGQEMFKVLDKAKLLEGQGKKIIHLELGQPRFEPPKSLIKKTIKSLKAKDVGYSSSYGIYSFRKKLNERLTKYYPEVEVDNVIISTANLLISQCLHLLTNPKDKVRKSLKDLIHVPFTFENSGSKVVLYQPGGLD